MKANSKRTFLIIFLLLALTLMLLPFLATASELFAAILNKFGWYRFLVGIVVPLETRAIAGLLQVVGYQVQAAPKAVSIFRNGAWETVGISWNCIGWQSLILFGITLLVGLQGNFSQSSKFECLVIGILGTILVNLLRLAAITFLIFNFNAIPATILHDYLSAFILILWLFFFWYFSYSFVLEER